MIARIRARVTSVHAGKRWLRLAGGIAINLLILAVVVAVYLSIFLIARPELAGVGGGLGGLIVGTVLFWGTMFVPTIGYLLILEFAVEGSSLTRRLWALALSPICAAPLYIAAIGGTHESLAGWLLQAFSLPLGYGAVVRLHRYSDGPDLGASA